MEKLNVAIADDNERMVQLLDEIVASDKDLQVVGTAKNGVEAYEIIKHKQPDVVLLDIVMPKLDGLALLEKVKKDKSIRKCPSFIIISAVGQDRITEDAFNLGAKKCSSFCQNQIKTYICLHVTYSALRLSSHLTSIRTKF